MSILADEVKREVERAGHIDLLMVTPLVVAVSGGADSLALLSVLAELRGERAAETLHVAHLDHGFRGEASAADAHFVEELADSRGLRSTIAHFDVPAFAAKHKLSSEDAARRVRYAFLAGVAQENGGVVAVAHTADDQAETVLMHLLRGSGISGLAGMRMFSERPVEARDPQLATLLRQPENARIQVFRPLLGAWRWEIEAHCQEYGVVPRHDASNTDMSYRRNYVRHMVLPSLEAASPRIKRQLANLAKIASAEDDILRDVTSHAWRDLGVEATGSQASVPAEALAQLPLGTSRRVVKRMLEAIADDTGGFSFDQIEGALSVLANAPDSPPALDLPGDVRVRRSNKLGIVQRRTHNSRDVSDLNDGTRPLVPKGTCLHLPTEGILPLGNGWEVSTDLVSANESLPTPGGYVALFDFDALGRPQHMELRTRRPGDQMRPLGMSGRKKLQDLLVDAKIPGDVRDRLPLIAPPGSHAELLWIPGPGGRRSALAPISDSTQRVLCITFRRSDQHTEEAEESA